MPAALKAAGILFTQREIKVDQRITEKYTYRKNYFFLI